MNLFQILQAAGGGEAFKAFGRQYGMSEDQVRSGIEALLPAFSAGVKQTTADPLGLMALLRQMAAGDFTRAYADPSILFGARRSEADNALRTLLGSAPVVEAVLKQASVFSGIAEEKLRELMAPLAALTLGGLAQHATAANPALDAMLKQFGSAASPSPNAPKGPLDRLEEEQARREAEASRTADMQRLQEQFMETGFAAFQAGASAWQRAMSDMMKGAAGGGASEPGRQFSGRHLFGEMFDSGVRLSEIYRREMEALVQRMATPPRE
jgi:hypothetical protein